MTVVSLKVIEGGMVQRKQEIKAQIKGILKEAANESADTVAEAIIAVCERQKRRRLKAILITFVSTVLLASLVYCYSH